MSDARFHRYLRRSLAPFVLAVATAVFLTWPLATHLQSRVLDDGTLDGFGFTWTLRWVRTAVASGQNPFFTRALFYPDGVALFWHTLCLPAGLLSLPFSLLPDDFRTALLAQNTLGLFATVATFLLGAALARDVTGSRGAGLVAGICLVANAFHLRQLHTPNVASLYWLVGALLLWRRLHAARRGWLVLAVAGVIATQFLAAPEYAVMALALLAYDLAYRLVRTRRRGEALWPAGATGALGLAALAPPLLVALFADATPAAPPLAQLVWNSAFATGFITPPWIPGPPAYLGPGLYLGSVALLLAAAGQILAPERATRWNLAALLCLVAALGPMLQLNAPGPDFYADRTIPDAAPGWPLPYRVAYALVPGLALGRSPWRWVGAARLCLVVAAACGAAALAGRLRSAPRLRIIGGMVLAVAALAEAFPQRLPAVHAPLPAGYELLARDAAGGAVLELPTGMRHGAVGLYSSLFMAYQAAHHRPLVEGTLARLPPGYRNLFARPDFHLAEHREIAYAVLHRPLFRKVYPPGPSRRLAREARRAGRLVFRSRELRIYRLTQGAVS